MLVNFERKVAFLLHPKTASRATSKALIEHSEFQLVSDHHLCWRENLWPNRKLIERGFDPDVIERWDDGNFREFVYVYVIRNPWDTLASWYEDMAHVSGQGLGPKWHKKFIRHHPKLFPREGLWPYLYDTPPGPTIVLRYEELQEELWTLSRILRFPNPRKLEVIGPTLTRAKDYRDYYYDESRAWVEDRFSEDIKAGEYTFDGMVERC